MNSLQIKRDVIAYARSLGFERVGVTSAEPLENAQGRLDSWLAQGRAGEMGYMEKNPSRRGRPADLLPGAKSVIALAMNYYNPSPLPSPEKGEGVHDVPSPTSGEGGRRPDEGQLGEGRISRYAWGRDYHKVIGKRLEVFTRYIEALAPDAACKTFVDTGPLLERPFAQRAGLGFIGKNTMLITKGLGSWVFLANVVTSLDLPPDAPDERSCGECRLCIDACPTGAITEPYQLDARRCIAYLTIELKGAIAPELREKTGEWMFGCDICQDVCPHNTRVPPTTIPEFKSSAIPVLSEILSIKNDEDFRRRFVGTALMRAGRAGLLRNACLAAANLNRQDLIPLLEERCDADEYPVVREQAAWALQKLRQTIAEAPNPESAAPDEAEAIPR